MTSAYHEPHNCFLSRLNDEELGALQPYLQTMQVHAEQWLQRIGDEQAYVILPHSGAIAVGMPGTGGTFIDTAFLGADGICGAAAALTGCATSYSACVRLSGDVARISAGAFRRALDESARMRDLATRCETAILIQAQQAAYCNALHPVEARLCRWLLQLHDRANGDWLPLTQDLLAQALGVRRTTVTAVAGKLQNAGIISWRRGTVQIGNRQALEQQVCDCYRAVRRQLDGLFNGMPRRAGDLIDHDGATVALAPS